MKKPFSACLLFQNRQPESISHAGAALPMQGVLPMRGHSRAGSIPHVGLINRHAESFFQAACCFKKIVVLNIGEKFRQYQGILNPIQYWLVNNPI